MEMSHAKHELYFTDGSTSCHCSSLHASPHPDERKVAQTGKAKGKGKEMKGREGEKRKAKGNGRGGRGTGKGKGKWNGKEMKGKGKEKRKGIFKNTSWVIQIH